MRGKRVSPQLSIEDARLFARTRPSLTSSEDPVALPTIGGYAFARMPDSVQRLLRRRDAGENALFSKAGHVKRRDA
jgi:hypothetical protein